MSVLDAQREVTEGLERMVEGLASWYSDNTGAVYICHSDPGDEQPCGPDNVGYARCSGGRDSCDGRWCRPTPPNNVPCIGCAERCGQCG